VGAGALSTPARSALSSGRATAFDRHQALSRGAGWRVRQAREGAGGLRGMQQDAVEAGQESQDLRGNLGPARTRRRQGAKLDPLPGERPLQVAGRFGRAGVQDGAGDLAAA